MTPTKKPDAEKRNAEREAALTFVRMAKEEGLDLTGPDGLLKQFTKSVLETALDEEMTGHLGRAKRKRSKDGRAANTRNGTTAKTVVADSVGPVGIEVPRDRDGSFEPVVVRKRRRLPGVDEVVLSLYARGLTTGEISARFQEIYGADVSRETVSRITER
ncbi:transposase, partial [Bifidobacterium longum]|uniref:transposase n=1 Tax=Bifidobacterium longum TaxID=216816 RepID=UPI0018E3EC94